MPRGVPGSKAPHGTTARYQGHGCRCDECQAAYREFARAYYGHRPMQEYLASIPRTQHGSERMYLRYKCRCPECVQAATDARRRRRKARTEPPAVHNRAGYTNGCRCDVCREAHRVYSAAWKAKRRATA